MANGPGLSWGAGVANARPSELTADALSTATAQAASHGTTNMHSPEASADGSTTDAPPTRSEPSGGAIAPGTKDAGSSSTTATPTGESSAPAQHVRFEEACISGGSTPPAHVPAEPTSPPQPVAASPSGGIGHGHATADTLGTSASSIPAGGNGNSGNGSGDSGNGTGSGAASGNGGSSSGDRRVTGAGGSSAGGTGGSGSGNGGSSKPGTGAATTGQPGGVQGAAAAGGGVGGGVGGSGGGGGGGGGPPQSALSSLEPSSSMLEHVSREVIRKLRLAASAGSAEDRHVVCEELFADITCALDASAQAALLGPLTAAKAEQGRSKGGGGAEAEAAGAPGSGGSAAGGVRDGGGGGEGGCADSVVMAAAAGRRGRVRGRLYYEVLAVYYASRGAADSARALLHLCQLLWDTPWVAPIYALLLHRFLLLPRESSTTATSPTAAAAAAAAGAAAGTATTSRGAGASSAGKAPSYGMSYSDPRVKHLNVLAHGARQLLLGDVHSGLSRFQPLWAFLALEVAGLGSSSPPRSGAGGDGGAAAAALPPVTSIDAVPVAARPWLLAVAAAFMPYYCLDEQVSELARRFPPPLPMEGGGGGWPGGGGGSGATAASLAGLDFLVVEVTDVLGRINSEAGLLKYLRALRALARPPPPPQSPPTPAGQQAAAGASGHAEGEAAAAAVLAATAAAAVAAAGGGGGVGGGTAGATAGRRKARAEAAAAPHPPAPEPPLAGLPTITKLRLQSELYSLTSGGGPRYAPPEVRRAAFAALDALFPGGRSLRWLVRWASRALHLEWLEGDAGASGSSYDTDPWAGRGLLGWVYWPIHWWTALYGKILLAIFQLIYGIVVWRPWRRGVEVAAVTGTGGAITAGGGAAVAAAAATAAAGLASGGVGIGVGPEAAGGGVTAAGGGGSGGGGPVGQEAGPGVGVAGGSRGRAGPWWQPRLRGQ